MFEGEKHPPFQGRIVGNACTKTVSLMRAIRYPRGQRNMLPAPRVVAKTGSFFLLSFGKRMHPDCNRRTFRR